MYLLHLYFSYPQPESARAVVEERPSRNCGPKITLKVAVFGPAVPFEPSSPANTVTAAGKIQGYVEGFSGGTAREQSHSRCIELASSPARD